MSLEIVSTKDLIIELQNRFDACIFLATQPGPKINDPGNYSVYTHGAWTHILGLLKIAELHIQASVQNKKEK
jgi:hypothetical protein